MIVNDMEFQLGHVFSDMEILNPWISPARHILVSIGPRLFRHGNSQSLDQSGAAYSCFNWATSFQTWK